MGCFNTYPEYPNILDLSKKNPEYIREISVFYGRMWIIVGFFCGGQETIFNIIDSHEPYGYDDFPLPKTEKV